MGRTRRRNELSSSSSSETSPKHKAKRNPADADVAAMACSVDKQDDTNPSWCVEHFEENREQH